MAWAEFRRGWGRIPTAPVKPIVACTRKRDPTRGPEERFGLAVGAGVSARCTIMWL